MVKSGLQLNNNFHTWIGEKLLLITAPIWFFCFLEIKLWHFIVQTCIHFSIFGVKKRWVNQKSKYTYHILKIYTLHMNETIQDNLSLKNTHFEHSRAIYTFIFWLLSAKIFQVHMKPSFYIYIMATFSLKFKVVVNILIYFKLYPHVNTFYL